MTINRLPEGFDEPWAQTFTGVPFRLLSPQPYDVNIDDLAHHLARINRFNGATDPAYTVAEHSVHVADLVREAGGSREAEIGGFFHDMGEFIVGDMIQPLKELFPRFAEIEWGILGAICDRYEVNPYWTILPAVMEADRRALATERRDLLGRCEEEWLPLPDPHPATIYPTFAARAEKRFRERFAEYGRKGWLHA